jgi:hypothetical protein
LAATHDREIVRAAIQFTSSRQAATRCAMPTYDDLFIRDSLSDTGQIPSGSASASYSPDVIVWGNETLPNPETYLVQNYNTTWYKNVVARETNYIYCRAKNLYTLPQTGSLYLYYAPGGVMSNIGVWRNNQLTTAIPGQDYLKLDARRPGEVVVGDTAFQWAPERAGHYCFIAQITTARNPNPLPQSFSSTETYVKWVLDNPAVAWRNTTVVDNASPPQYQQDYGFQNLDDFEREYIFRMTSENLPVESTMSMVCSALAPRPPIDIEQTTGRGSNWSLTQTSFLPGNFSATLTSTATLPAGMTWTGDMAVWTEDFAITQQRDSDYLKSFARPVADWGITDPKLVARGAFAIRLGRYTVQTMTEETLPA